ncbi:MAG: TIGR02147 family protein [Bacteriovoracia bacterium]
MSGQENKPRIFSYRDYRGFIRDHVEHMKRWKPGFSFRHLSRVAGLSSPNYFRWVIDGKRNLTTDTIKRFAKALGLNQHEKRYFESLVRFNQADNPEAQRRFEADLVKNSQFEELRPIRELQLDYYARWYYIPIREMAAARDFREDPAWIAAQLSPPISADEAREALTRLQAIGLLQRNTEGRLELSEPVVTTPDDVVSVSVAKFHRQMILMAAESLKTVPKREREVSSVTLLASADQFARMKDLLRNFKDELLKIAGEGLPTSGRVYQLNFQLYPISKAVGLQGPAGATEEASSSALPVVDPKKKAA